MRRSRASLAWIEYADAAGRPRLLTRWNARWQAFALVGGHREGDESQGDCLRREIAEELGLFDGRHYRVEPETPRHLEYVAFSESAGEETAYAIDLFRVALSSEAIGLVNADPENRWVTPEEVRCGATGDGRRVSPTVQRLFALATESNPMTADEILRRLDRARLDEYRGRFDDARIALRALLPDAERHGDLDLLQDARFRLGKLLIYGGHRHYDEADTVLALARETAAQNGRPRQISVALNYLALLARHRQDLDAAERFLGQERLNRSSPPGPEVGQWFHYRGLVAQARHDAALAERMYLRAVQVYDEIPLRSGLAEAYDSYANLMLYLGKPKWALTFAARSLEALDSQDLYGRAIGHGTLGRAALLQTRYDEAKQHFEADLALATELNDDRGIGHMLNSLGELHLRLKEYDKAESRYRENLAADRGPNNAAHAHWGLARVFLAQNRLPEAVAAADAMGVALKDQPLLAGLGEVLLGLRGAIAWRDGATAEGESKLRAASNWLRGHGYDADAVPFLYELRDLYQSGGRTEDAVAAMGQALEILDRSGAERGVRDVEEWLRAFHQPGLIRLALSQQLPEWLADSVAAGRLSRPPSRLQELTVLFCDLRGFTTWSEKTAPELVVEALNEWFGDATRIIRFHKGTVDKFIGDCVMALFGVPEPGHDDAANAVRAALEMSKTIYALNLRRKLMGEPPLHVGIGIHSGPAVVGFLGSNLRQSFTAIGDTVNTASRIESATKEFEGSPILISEATRSRLGGANVGDVAFAGHAKLKGKEEAVAVYQVRGGSESDEA